MKKEINPVLKRLSEWADQKGGYAEIGRRIDKHPAMFYNLVRRDALPSLATLTEIAKAFPDLDLNYIIRGELSINTIDNEEVAQLKDQIRIKDATIQRLVMPAPMGKAKGATTCPGRDTKYRRAAAAQVMRITHRPARKPVFTPGRVQEFKMSSLTAGYGQGVRLQ